ncbi:MAG: translation initiation factor IF-3 [Candidatus Brocadiales bacterium]
MPTIQELRINERVRAKMVRLIDENGAQAGIISRDEALERAKGLELDLVEVAPTGNPPVCRIMNYGKHKYKLKKKSHQKHHSVQLKELRLRPKTDDHDLETKMKQARKFLGKKDRVLVNMLFRGRERAHTDIGREILKQFAVSLEDIAKVEKNITLEGRRMNMILAPKI